ncbi:MAG: phosphatidylserine decarboxylase [Maribacter sp.]|uniref:phosphatidylserine decarboxylase n=1 Tax=Maribacter sp. TaxID=1897614 RepID=UPI003297A734
MPYTYSITSEADVHFTVFKVPHWRAFLYQFISVVIWGGLPSPLQRKVSAWYASFYTRPYSKRIIRPYIKLNYSNKNYLDNFRPPHGKNEFENFQDFFTREFRRLPYNASSYVWPCEGLLCDMGYVHPEVVSRVKSDTRRVHTIFQLEERNIPKDYFFTNVFLHNKNYHRIHAPVTGTVSRIQHVPGDLVILRPWIYKKDPSLPALRNERYNIDIIDYEGRTWYLSIVGGPAVGTIALPKKLVRGAQVAKLEEIALFYLGSTCCMAAPVAPRYHDKNCFVQVGATY